jgi:membrane protein implicated in regulation of membrane protease activity
MREARKALGDLDALVSGDGANRVSPVNGFLNWWDGTELWLSGLAFVLQAMVVMPVVLVLAYITAALLDRLLGKGIQLMRRAHHADGARG